MSNLNEVQISVQKPLVREFKTQHKLNIGNDKATPPSTLGGIQPLVNNAKIFKKSLNAHILQNTSKPQQEDTVRLPKPLKKPVPSSMPTSAKPTARLA